MGQLTIDGGGASELYGWLKLTDGLERASSDAPDLDAQNSLDDPQETP
jgi:hypothetical protein